MTVDADVVVMRVLKRTVDLDAIMKTVSALARAKKSTLKNHHLLKEESATIEVA